MCRYIAPIRSTTSRQPLMVSSKLSLARHCALLHKHTQGTSACEFLQSAIENRGLPSANTKESVSWFELLVSGRTALLASHNCWSKATSWGLGLRKSPTGQIFLIWGWWGDKCMTVGKTPLFVLREKSPPPWSAAAFGGTRRLVLNLGYGRRSGPNRLSCLRRSSGVASGG